MLLEKETFEQFHYNTGDLANGSRKKVVVQCDYCSRCYETTMKIYNTGRQKFPKDACKQCRFKKREETSMAKHGVKNSAQRKDVRQKIKDSKKYVDEQAALEKRRGTCLEKYGTANIAQSDHSKEKYKQTCLEKYGVENASSVEEFKEKRKQTNKRRYGHEYYLGSQDRVEKSIKTKIENGQIQLHEGLNKKEWSQKLGLSHSHFSELVNKYGWDYAVSHEKKRTGIEQLVFDYLTELDIEFEYNEKLDRFYPDFIIPDNNLIIEVDGLFWHSDEVQEDDNYHVTKRSRYIELGYTPLFFREDEILNKLDIVKSIINNKLGISKRIFARKLTASKLSSEESAEFFNENHLMGNGQGQTFALLDKDMPVCAIKMRRRKENNWEVSRFCPKRGLNIVGGFSKLLKAFERGHTPKQIMTFIDKRYGSGEYLSELGFSLDSCHKSFKWTNGVNTYHRMKFPSSSGYSLGLSKIWDCGQAKWVKCT